MSFGIEYAQNIASVVDFGAIGDGRTDDSQNIASVVDFGAIGDGRTDDSQAFLKAWGNVCGSNAILQVPQNKTFLLQPVTSMGPCCSNTVHFQKCFRLSASFIPLSFPHSHVPRFRFGAT
ncbi:hypothetical protein JCGZ_07175 [Jatropha curcas]|uniref:Pectate lyase superfamily protein domain-containing protein n=1 Tax=Jatropha curcas TaxID=180498 RepID=A0A067KP77_JATCU|nr:hypothetical protein JCGZ_07175 [Jatropha curcas]